MSTTDSLNTPRTHLPPTIPPYYLQNVIVSILQRKGFDSSEAGAITEIERLLENRQSQVPLPCLKSHLKLDLT